ncbi:hypothetical protein MTO96_002510 [Rhipicephalus appendiculatus]
MHSPPAGRFTLMSSGPEGDSAKFLCEELCFPESQLSGSLRVALIDSYNEPRCLAVVSSALPACRYSLASFLESAAAIKRHSTQSGEAGGDEAIEPCESWSVVVVAVMGSGVTGKSTGEGDATSAELRVGRAGTQGL